MTDWTPEALAADAERRDALEVTGMCPDSGLTIAACWDRDLCDCSMAPPRRCDFCGVKVWDIEWHRARQQCVDTDTRCTHHDGAGQCLDHQGHQGRHQPPAPPLSVEYPCTECGHVASQHYDEPHPYDAGCRECVDCNGFVSEAPAPPLSVSEG